LPPEHVARDDRLVLKPRRVTIRLDARADLATDYLDKLQRPDPGALERFYQRLGLTLLAREDDRVWLAAGERARLGIWSPGFKEHADRGGRHVHFALSTGRGTLERLTAELRGDGVAVEGPVEHEGGDRSVYFSDPEGNRVELWDFFQEKDGAQEGVDALAERSGECPRRRRA
jgi:catechol 2,3-dioxygenase-like lactoylglutathione lyase family enzyme